ncbi:MAG: hypothetical protein K6F34_10825 [Lachnospiraceae bacterium]|nr:hypothetical protein [Lachnospiraceae bacterium]
MSAKNGFILNLITSLIWLAAGIFSIVIQGRYAGMCFTGFIIFGYMTITSYKRWKAEKND